MFRSLIGLEATAIGGAGKTQFCFPSCGEPFFLMLSTLNSLAFPCQWHIFHLGLFELSLLFHWPICLSPKSNSCYENHHGFEVGIHSYTHTYISCWLSYLKTFIPLYTFKKLNLWNFFYKLKFWNFEFIDLFGMKWTFINIALSLSRLCNVFLSWISLSMPSLPLLDLESFLQRSFMCPLQFHLSLFVIMFPG